MMSAEPARLASAEFIAAPYDDHARVLLTCSCGTVTDLTFALDQHPGSQPCTGCGAILPVPEPG